MLNDGINDSSYIGQWANCPLTMFPAPTNNGVQNLTQSFEWKLPYPQLYPSPVEPEAECHESTNPRNHLIFVTKSWTRWPWLAFSMFGSLWYPLFFHIRPLEISGYLQHMANKYVWSLLFKGWTRILCSPVYLFPWEQLSPSLHMGVTSSLLSLGNKVTAPCHSLLTLS